MDERPTILAVDDTEDNLDLLEFALKRKPVRVLRASSGIECLQMAEKERPDLILLDIQMPGMDGFEVLQHLRSRATTSSIPVIVLTAQKKDPESIERGLLMGADEYLTKPIDTDELLVRTQTLIRLHKAEQELEKTKADFMAMLVHDLRAPITGVKGVIDFLYDVLREKSQITPDHIMLLGSAQMSVNKTIELINELLDLSRYQAGSINLERTSISVEEMIDSVRSQLELQFRNRGITVRTVFEPSLPEAFVDPRKIMQVLMNLLSNAYKFTDQGGTVAIEVAEVRTDGHPMLQISVKNTGAGIHSEEISKIFSVYQQGSSARGVEEKGSGLGLAICKLMIEAHGGTISVESNPGVLTTFRFTLPVYTH